MMIVSPAVNEHAFFRRIVIRRKMDAPVTGEGGAALRKHGKYYRPLVTV